MLQKIDALYEAMTTYELKPRISFKLTHTRVYAERKLGVRGFDSARGFTGGQAYFQYIERLDARSEYHDLLRVTDGTSFYIENAPYDSLMGAWDAIRPVLRAIEKYQIQPEEELISLF